jgi:negative regulator of sigma-B (phosphoserine phosphatase)
VSAGAGRGGSFDTAFATSPKVGERANGDRAFVHSFPGGRTVLGVIDALGHGVEAEEVSVRALDVLARTAAEGSVERLMHLVHEGLRGMRGVAATFCVVVDGRLEACGVGNVELRCVETDIPFIVSPGILGVRVHRFRTCTAALVPGSRLVLFSDGVHRIGSLSTFRKLSPAEASQAILRLHRRNDDDATVLVADLG